LRLALAGSDVEWRRNAGDLVRGLPMRGHRVLGMHLGLARGGRKDRKFTRMLVRARRLKGAQRAFGWPLAERP
jgi:hypothetical protein